LEATDFNHPFWRGYCCKFENIFRKKQRKVTMFRLELTDPKGRYMKVTKNIFVVIILLFATGWFACNKPDNGTIDPGPYKLSYGDSIIYLKDQAGDYIVSPTEHRDGIYSVFPEGLEINDATGAINVSKSETGLRYRITHKAPDGTETSTMVVLSGVTFSDKYHHFSQNDTMSFPVYNASEARVLPLNGSVFDEGNGANSGGCSVRTDNGKINLAQCVRNGVFGATPQNNVRRDFDIVYRLNDGSNKAQNKIRVRLYYYNTMADVPADVLQDMQARQDEGVFLRNSNLTEANNITRLSNVAKPRPPCVIIIAN
jgi:hypothetical protein